MDWKARHAAVVAAEGDEWDHLNDAYEADWREAYCTEFVRYALLRGWTRENIDSGWLEDLPRDAPFHHGHDADPAECAREDVKACEDEAYHA